MQQVLCDDLVIRDDMTGRRTANGERRVSTRAWCDQYKIPRRTFENWLLIHQDPRRSMRDGHGKPAMIDQTGIAEVKEALRQLQTATETHQPLPAKAKEVSSILVKAATTTLGRTGKTQFSGEKVTMSLTTAIKYRDSIALKRKAHDISDARYQALNNTQHMYQSAVMFTAATSHLAAGILTVQPSHCSLKTAERLAY